MRAFGRDDFGDAEGQEGADEECDDRDQRREPCVGVFWEAGGGETEDDGIPYACLSVTVSSLWPGDLPTMAGTREAQHIIAAYRSACRRTCHSS